MKDLKVGSWSQLAPVLRAVALATVAMGSQGRARAQVFNVEFSMPDASVWELVYWPKPDVVDMVTDVIVLAANWSPGGGAGTDLAVPYASNRFAELGARMSIVPENAFAELPRGNGPNLWNSEPLPPSPYFEPQEQRYRPDYAPPSPGTYGPPPVMGEENVKAFGYQPYGSDAGDGR